MTPSKQLLLFDLGGVLVQFTGFEGVRKLLREELTEEDILQRWLGIKAGTDFELGALSPAEFAEAFLADWPLGCTSDEFLVEYRSWTRCLYPGAVELLDELRPRYRLAALSNSNAVHWERNNVDLGVGALFERAFSSHEVGMRKPDPEFYRHALKELSVGPHEVVFFDDVMVNVEAAQQLGIESHQVIGVDGLRSRLTELGLLA